MLPGDVTGRPAAAHRPFGQQPAGHGLGLEDGQSGVDG